MSRRCIATDVSSTARKKPETQKPITGTTVCPRNGTNPRAKSRIPKPAARSSTWTLSRRAIQISCHSGRSGLGGQDPSDSSTFSDSDS